MASNRHPDLFAVGGDPQFTALADLSRRMTRYASGLSRPRDFTPAAWSGHGVGVEAGELSPVAIEGLAVAATTWATPIFVDTGAFGCFMRGVRGGDVKAIDFDQVFTRYDNLLTRIGELNSAEEQVPPPLLVMPDVVGQQLASIDLIAKHRDYVATTALFHRVARPVIPIQRGPLSLSQAYDRICAILGTDRFIVGVPSNAAAVTGRELTDFVQASRPSGLHILGAFAESRLRPRLGQILRGNPPENLELSCDANPLRSIIISRGQGATDRAAALAHHLGRRSRQEELEAFLRHHGGADQLRNSLALSGSVQVRRVLQLLADLGDEPLDDVIARFAPSITPVSERVPSHV